MDSTGQDKTLTRMSEYCPRLGMVLKQQWTWEDEQVCIWMRWLTAPGHRKLVGDGFAELASLTKATEEAVAVEK